MNPPNDELDLTTCNDLEELTRECRRLAHSTNVRISSQDDAVNLARDLAGVLRAYKLGREQLRNVRTFLLGEQGKCERALVNYRSRCPALASDVGPEHTAARVLAFALANDWSHVTHSLEPEYMSLVHPTNDRGAFHIAKQYEDVAHRNYAVALFCGYHAQASGMAPLDVLAAIGAMP